MPQNRMKPETLVEARDRLLEMSAAERRGFEAAAEGQVIGMPEGVNEDPERTEELHRLTDALRLMPSIQDRPDEDAVAETQDSVVAAQVERRELRRGAVDGERKAGRKAGRKAKADVEKAE